MAYEEKLPGDYIAGFVDGEGCFALKFSKETKRKRSGSPEYFNWRAEFAILLKEDDIRILGLIKNTLGVGSLSLNYSRGKTFARYSVQNIKELHEVIVPFFNKYSLRAKKAEDFKLWKKAISIIYKNNDNNNFMKGVRGFIKKQWEKDDIEKLFQIRSKMFVAKGENRNVKYRHGISKTSE